MQSQNLSQEYKWLYFLIALAALVNLSGLFIPLIDPDAGVYASISKQMVQTGNWLELFHKGTDWLDKPHFQFWITAIFFKLFGISTWAYKLPGILFVFMGGAYTYLFARKYYTQRTALWSVFILLTAEHIIISNNDVRAEPYLTGLIIAAVYHFSNTLLKIDWKHLILASFFTACALMTKGPFALIPIVAAVAGELLRKNWKQVFHWKWLVVLFLVAIFITPELYSLWYQFDRHPEKIVFGRTNVSGIKFFLWDSQFGRFTNTGPIKGIGEPTFFLHTLLWAFLPWSLLMYAALFERIKKIRTKSSEQLTLIGSLVTIIIFSFSRFQLPYYTNIIFPFLAILTASWIDEKRATNKKGIAIIQNIVAAILVLGLVFLQYYYSPSLKTIWPIVVFILIILPGFLLTNWLKDQALISLLRSGIFILAINFYLNTVFYSDLMQYHSGKEAAFYINKTYPGEQGFYFNRYSASLDFYLKNGLIKADPDSVSVDLGLKKGVWYLTPEEVNVLRSKNIAFEVLKELPEYRISMLSLKFLNKRTRKGELKTFYLVRLI